MQKNEQEIAHKYARKDEEFHEGISKDYLNKRNAGEERIDEQRRKVMREEKEKQWRKRKCT